MEYVLLHVNPFIASAQTHLSPNNEVLLFKAVSYEFSEFVYKGLNSWEHISYIFVVLRKAFETVKHVNLIDQKSVMEG